MAISKSIVSSIAASSGFDDPLILEKHTLTESGTVTAPANTRAALITATGGGGYVTGSDSFGSASYSKFMYYDKINSRFLKFSSDSGQNYGYVHTSENGFNFSSQIELYNSGNNTGINCKSGYAHIQQYVEVGDRLFMPGVFLDRDNTYYEYPLPYWDLTNGEFVTSVNTGADDIYFNSHGQPWWYDKTTGRLWCFSATKVGYFDNLDGEITYTSAGTHGVTNPTYIYAKGDFVIVIRANGNSMAATEAAHEVNISSSTDGGATFTVSDWTFPGGYSQSGSNFFGGICFSDDCSKIYIATYNSSDYHVRIWKSSDSGLTFTYGTFVDIYTTNYSSGALYTSRYTLTGIECDPDGLRVYGNEYVNTGTAYRFFMYTEADDSITYFNTTEYVSAVKTYDRKDDGTIIGYAGSQIVEFSSDVTTLENGDITRVFTGLTIDGRYTSNTTYQNVYIDEFYNVLLQNAQHTTGGSHAISISTDFTQAESTTVTIGDNSIELKGGYHNQENAEPNGLGGSVPGPNLPYADALNIGLKGEILDGVQGYHQPNSSTRYPKPPVPQIFEGLDQTSTNANNEAIAGVPGRGAGYKDFEQQSTSDQHYMGGAAMSCYRYVMLCQEDDDVVCDVAKPFFDGGTGIVIVEFVA